MLLLQVGGSLCLAANWPNLCAGLFLLPGPTVAQVRTGEKVVTEMGQQGALQSNYQHKEADNITWHFIYLDTFYNEERKTLSKKIYRIEILKKERTVSRSCQRGPPIVSLCGVQLWRGQACSAHSPENAKETSATPAPPAEDTRHLPWFDCSHLSDSPYHFIAGLSSHSSPAPFSPPSG